MPKKIALPKYRKQAGSNGADRAFVEIAGRRVYLGLFASAASREAYDRLISEWLAAGRRAPRPVEPEASAMTVVEVLARWDEHAKEWYRRADGTPTREHVNFKGPLSVVRQLYGRSAAKGFDPVALKAVRQKMISKGWNRTYVNSSIRRIKTVFTWAVSEKLVPPDVLTAIRSVRGLMPGRSAAPEPEAVRPVSDDVIAATLPHLPEVVQAMVKVQRATGMRSGELVALRASRLDMRGPVWLYKVLSHKTAHHGRQRIVSIGPRAQETLRPFLANRPIDKPIFSPRESEQQRREEEHAARETPMSCGNIPGSNRVSKPKRAPGESYTSATYAKAINRACQAAGIDPAWHPHQLRHSLATELRRVGGLDVAAAALGHASMKMTEAYAEIDSEKVRETVLKIG